MDDNPVWGRKDRYPIKSARRENRFAYYKDNELGRYSQYLQDTLAGDDYGEIDRLIARNLPAIIRDLIDELSYRDYEIDANYWRAYLASRDVKKKTGA